MGQSDIFNLVTIGGNGGLKINSGLGVIFGPPVSPGTTTTTTTLLPTLFVTKWSTTASNQTIALAYTASGVYSGVIYWGDGTTSSNTPHPWCLFFH